MKKFIIKPVSFEMSLGECPPGLFLFKESLGFKSEYGDIFCGDSGEYFWAGASGTIERDKLKVIPLESIWEDE